MMKERLLTRVGQCTQGYTQRRYKRVQFKEKVGYIVIHVTCIQVAPVNQQKTPSMVALDHFDFTYGPLYGSEWNSMRLALLSPNKYVAIGNTMAEWVEGREYNG